MAFKYFVLKSIWNILVACITIYAAIIIPIDLAFESHLLPQSYAVIAIIFLADFILNLLKFIKSKRRAECVKVEDETWFQRILLFTDFLAAIPVELIFPQPYFKLFRLIKLLRTNNTFKTYQHRLIQYASTFSFITFIFWFILSIHALSCGWHALRIHDHFTDFSSDYINSLYWTVTTITTVGYGDITPVSNAQKLYAIMVQVLGFGVFTFMIGTVASQLMRKNPATVRYQENLESLASLMHYRSLPIHLRRRITEFYKYMWKKRVGYDETVFLNSLPENLQTEVALHLKNEVIEKVAIFQNASQEFKQNIALSLKPIFLTPGDYIFKTGHIAQEMYFVVSGELKALPQSEERVLTELKAGDYFGEIALLKNKNRTATVKATTYCDLYTLDKNSFDKVICNYPEIGKFIRTTVEERERNYSV